MYFRYKVLVASAALVGGAAAFEGSASYYYPSGPGACGISSNSSDFVAELNSAQYAGGAHCGQNITVQYGGEYVNATVVDECGCGEYGINLSPAAFEQLASISKGRIEVTWNFD